MCKLRNSWSNFSLESLLQIAANVKIIEKRLKTRSTQFVIKFENFIFNVYTVQLIPLISCNEDKTTYTSKFSEQFYFGKFITNCGKCENHRKSQNCKVNAICNEGSKTSSLCLNCCVLSPD